jgi:outer membrane protein assembly factor BamE (lipoprotein component of BamABCDE complex)
MLRKPSHQTRRRLSIAAASVLAAASLAGCAADAEQRGDLPERSALSQIHPGATTRDQVVQLLGSPSSTGVFDANSWYYISKETKQVSFLAPDVVDQQVYVINFDGGGVVRSVEHKTLRDAENVPMAPGATPAPGRELTFMEQVLGNLGRFNQGGSSSGGGTGESSQSVADGNNPERDTNLIGPH